MGVLQFPIAIPVTVGTLPSLKFMVTTDNFTQITTSGYLNSGNIDSANPMAPTDFVTVIYNYDSRFQTGTIQIFTVTIDVRGVITLNLWNGGVVLPVEVNDIAMFYNTQGSIYDGINVIARHLGNMQAGTSGTQGGYISYPSTPTSGKFIFEASANFGDFTGVLTNMALAQSSNFFLPDPNVANASVVVSPFNMVNDNLVKSIGILGLVADTGISYLNVMQKNISNQLTPSGSIVANKVNGSESGNLVTANGMAGVITTSGLTTAGGSSYAITWTNSFITTTSVVMLTLSGGTNTIENIMLKVIPGSGTATLTIYNNTAATPLNGTIAISYLVF